LADAVQAKHEYKLELHGREDLKDLDALVLAVPHRVLIGDLEGLLKTIKPKGWLIDIKSAIDPATLPSHIQYWSL
jgi:UDP-N-acetyl-D-galactosamine dehydrogenase